MNGKKNTFLKKWDRSIKVNKKNLKLFWYYIYERQNIWYRRFILKQPFPWTKDKIFKDYKFTNVYRELDKNTIYTIDNICNKDIEPKEKLFEVITYRLFNNPDTFNKIGIPTLKSFNRDKFYNQLEEISNSGNNPFTNAYLVHSGGIKGYSRNNFYSDLIRIIRDKIDVIYKKINKYKSLEEVCSYLSKFPSIGDFIAYEIALDLIYAKLIPYTENDWANVGPGCKLGLMLCFPALKEKHYLDKMKYLRDNYKHYFKKYGFKDFKYLKDKDGNKIFTLRVIENGFCETSKLWKMVNKIGKQRMRFTPTTKIRKPR